MKGGAARPLYPQDSGDMLLEWFANQRIPMLESRLRLGGLEYFHFASFFGVADGRNTSGHGSDPDRRIAAIKCVGEMIERQVVSQFFLDHKALFPKAIHNSNGWAIHTSLDEAKKKSAHEAIERHLLLKSFFSLGWKGFHLVQSIPSEEMMLNFLVSRFTADGLAAGIVIAQSPKYDGVSFGYSVGEAREIQSAAFWQKALFEAVDKILILSGDPPETSGRSWIRREVNRFLQEPFCFADLGAGSSMLVPTDLGQYETRVMDLSPRFGFPLFAAFTFGGNLIPLFWKSELGESDLAYIQPILRRNGISEIPERHPIL